MKRLVGLLATSIALVLIAPMAHAQPVKTPYTEPHRGAVSNVVALAGPLKMPYTQPHTTPRPVPASLAPVAV